MTERKQCCFFEKCAAYIVRERIRDIRGITHEKKWSERFCFANSLKCPHFEKRKRFQQAR